MKKLNTCVRRDLTRTDPTDATDATDATDPTDPTDTWRPALRRAILRERAEVADVSDLRASDNATTLGA